MLSILKFSLFSKIFPAFWFAFLDILFQCVLDQFQGTKKGVPFWVYSFIDIRDIYTVMQKESADIQTDIALGLKPGKLSFFKHRRQ